MRRTIRLLSFIGIVCTLAAVAYAFHGAVSFDPEAASAGNARLLAFGVAQYAQDNDETLPITTSEAAFRTAMAHYVPDVTVFVDPVTNTDFVPNPALSGLSLAAINDFSNTMLFEDAVAHPDGKKTSAMLDGTVFHGGVEYGDPNQVCVDRASKLGLSVIQYVQDNDEQYPPMTTQAAFEKAVLPYSKSHRIFVCPSTGDLFQPNPALSFVSLGSLADPAQVVLFSDPTPHADGIKTVGYADGHVVHGKYKPYRMGAMPVMSSACASNLRQLSLGSMQYMQDYDEHFPVYKNYSQFKAALLPYVGAASLFKCPDTGLDYAVNPALSGVAIYNIDNPSAVWTLRDSAPNNDGGRNTAFLNGHVDAPSHSKPLAILVAPDGSERLLWQKSDGSTQLWTLDNTNNLVSVGRVATDPSPIISATVDASGLTFVLRDLGNTAEIQALRQNGSVRLATLNGPYAEWSPAALAIGPNQQPHLAWNRLDGQISDWNMTSGPQYQGNVRIGPLGNYTAKSLSVAQDNTQRLLVVTDGGLANVLVLEVNGTVRQTLGIRAYPNWIPSAVVAGANGSSYVLSVSTQRTARIQYCPISGRNGTLINIATPAGIWIPVGFALGVDGNYRVLFIGETTALVESVAPDGTVVNARQFARP